MPQSDTLLPNALTTRSKVKNRLGLPASDTSADILIDDLINQTTMYLESICNRKFLSQSYLKELYDTDGGKYIFLKQLPVSVISAVYIRGGSIDVPTWTLITPSTYFADYLDEGMIRFVGNLPKNGRHLIAVDYTAGFLIDFTAELDNTKHTLGFDLTGLATNLVVKNVNLRTAHGFKTEQVEGQKQEYDFDLTEQEQAIVNKYSKVRLTI